MQCYGADATADRRGTYVARKIAEDFEKARLSFGVEMHAWIFAQNLFEGLPFEAEIALRKLQSEHPTISISSTTREDFERMIFPLGDEALIEDLLGQAPTDSIFSGIDIAALQEFLKGLANHPASSDDGADILRVSREKLAYNRLSQYSAAALDRRFERDVTAFVTGSADPSLGDRASEALNQKYQVLRAQHQSPDEILSDLLYFILGEGRISTPSIGEDVAAHAILAYFFFRCDIFEDVPSELEI